MRKIYSLALVAMMVMPFGLKAQDTLMHYDLFGAEGVQAPLETQAQPTPWGYRYGHGAFGLKEFAEKFSTNDEMYVQGVLVLVDDLFFGASSSDNAFVRIYGVDNEGKRPMGSGMAEKEVAMTDLSAGMPNPNIIMLDEAVSVNGEFFASFGFPGYDFNVSSPNYTPTEDTVGIYVTFSRAEDPAPATAWRNVVRYPQDNWENTNFILSDSLNFCIAPILTMDNGDTSSFVPEIAFGQSGLQVEAIYPNPATDFVKLSIDADKASQSNFTIYNMNGQQVAKNSRSLLEGSQEIMLDVSQLKGSANYILVIGNSEGMSTHTIRKK